jgi:hypothetical protein
MNIYGRRAACDRPTAACGYAVGRPAVGRSVSLLVVSRSACGRTVVRLEVLVQNKIFYTYAYIYIYFYETTYYIYPIYDIVCVIKGSRRFSSRVQADNRAKARDRVRPTQRFGESYGVVLGLGEAAVVGKDDQRHRDSESGRVAGEDTYAIYRISGSRDAVAVLEFDPPPGI